MKNSKNHETKNIKMKILKIHTVNIGLGTYISHIFNYHECLNFPK